MPIGRRDFLKIAGLGVSGSVLASSPLPAAARAPGSADSASMLYDATLCVGCRACQFACKQRANLPAETDAQGLYEMPVDLSANTWTMIKLYKDSAGGKSSFVKNQCMHCVDPACVSVCPVAALEKLESGPVVYHADRCIGCRYCMAACPFGIPKSEWDKSLPVIQKCDFCADRQAQGESPACSEACPAGALIYGKRLKLLEVAHTRLESDRKYYPKVYGESEVGGTSMLYISGVSFDKLGFPELKGQPLSQITWPYMLAVPWVVGIVATLSTAIYFRTHREEKANARKEADHGR